MDILLNINWLLCLKVKWNLETSLIRNESCPLNHFFLRKDFKFKTNKRTNKMNMPEGYKNASVRFSTVTVVQRMRKSRYWLHVLIRGAHIMFCNLDKLMTTLLCFLHYIIDQFRNICDKKYLIPYNHFHSLRQNVR